VEFVFRVGINGGGNRGGGGGNKDIFGILFEPEGF